MIRQHRFQAYATVAKLGKVSRQLQGQASNASVQVLQTNGDLRYSQDTTPRETLKHNLLVELFYYYWH